MKGTLILFALLGASATVAQTPAPTPSSFTPGVFDLAFDWLDAIEAQADALDKPDAVYIPIESDAKKMMRKFQRATGYDGGQMSGADEQIYAPMATYSLDVSYCRIVTTPDCSPLALSSERDRVDRALRDLQKASK